MENHYVQWKIPLKIAIFHSYVSHCQRVAGTQNLFEEVDHVESPQDAGAPESSEKFVKAMCDLNGMSFLGPGGLVWPSFPGKKRCF